MRVQVLLIMVILLVVFVAGCISESGHFIPGSNNSETSWQLSDVNLVEVLRQNASYLGEFLIIEGTAKNSGNRTLNCIRISAEFYDEGKTLLDVGSSFPEHYIEP